jgi:purine-binding chemotaxis protein CheW
MKNETIAYLTFSLGAEKFAIPVEHVQEVVEYGHVTKVPNAPDYMAGVINLRGRVLPLLDTKLKLGLPATVQTQRTRILVVEIQEGDKTSHLGAMVDVAREVIEINQQEIIDAPGVEQANTTTPITGILNSHGDITLIMDIHKVFSANQVEELTTSL